MVARTIQALYNNFSLEPKRVTHPPYARLGVAVAGIKYPLSSINHNIPTSMSTLYPLSSSVPSSVSHIIPTSSPPYKHPPVRSTHIIPTFIPTLQALEKWRALSLYIYSITHFTVLLRIQLLSMIYWYHNWFYLNYNPTSLPMHSLSFVHHVKGTSCQCPRPTTHLQAMILCPQQSLLLICVHGRACVPIILWCTLQEENEFRIQLLIV